MLLNSLRRLGLCGPGTSARCLIVCALAAISQSTFAAAPLAIELDAAPVDEPATQPASTIAPPRAAKLNAQRTTFAMLRARLAAVTPEQRAEAERLLASVRSNPGWTSQMCSTMRGLGYLDRFCCDGLVTGYQVRMVSSENFNKLRAMREAVIAVLMVDIRERSADLARRFKDTGSRRAVVTQLFSDNGEIRTSLAHNDKEQPIFDHGDLDLVIYKALIDLNAVEALIELKAMMHMQRDTQDVNLSHTMCTIGTILQQEEFSPLRNLLAKLPVEDEDEGEVDPVTDSATSNIDAENNSHASNSTDTDPTLPIEADSNPYIKGSVILHPDHSRRTRSGQNSIEISDTWIDRFSDWIGDLNNPDSDHDFLAEKGMVPTPILR